MTDFATPELILKVVAEQKKGLPKGIYSICSANPAVIRAAMVETVSDETWLLVESTCNQVNQDGGYTGMKPADFVDFVAELAQQNDYPRNRILLGGDHLGPNPWKSQPAAIAMEKSKVMVRMYVEAGYRKIHLDTTMACADDPQNGPLDPEIEAGRTAALCKVAEETWQKSPELGAPVYVIGTEVPVPGGAEDDEEGLQVTDPAHVRKTLAIYQKVFEAEGLSDAFERVIAMVVQPGVEFSHSHIHEYDRKLAQPLSRLIETIPGMVYEAHSTDYQLPQALRDLVVDHFGILKVGPALTFAFREVVFALAQIEHELFHLDDPEKLSHLIDTVDEVMQANPKDWQAYYHGSEAEKAYARKYSYSDRIRYYWTNPRVAESLDRLMRNLREKGIPLPLVSQYLPVQYDRIRQGTLRNDPDAIILDHIQDVVRVYRQACGL